MPALEAKNVSTGPEKDIQERIEWRRSYEREIGRSIERVDSTTLPWEVRMAVRDAEFQFIDAPPGLGDNYGIQILYNSLEDKKNFLSRTHYGDDAKEALGFDIEPWRATPIISSEHQIEIAKSLYASIEKQKQGGAVIADPKEYVKKALEELSAEANGRVPFLCKELDRSRDELSRIRKITFLWWNWKNAASGQEVGQLYLDSKLPVLPRPKDFALLFQAPSYFLAKDEAAGCPGYPEEEKVKAFLEAEGRKGNEPLGKLIEKETRLIYLVALSDNPERVMEWKLRSEGAALNKILVEKGVNPVYLTLKEKGINYNDVGEEQKIADIIVDLTEEKKEEIKNSWWVQFGFKNETEGRVVIGDPEMWIPIKARRGEPSPPDSGDFINFDKENVKRDIENTLRALKKDWQALSPLEDLGEEEKGRVKADIKDKIKKLRELATIKGEDGKLKTLVVSLNLERELGVRGKATEFGCFWARPQLAEDKEKVMEEVFVDFVDGDKLAFEQAQAVAGLFGFTAKWGYYARDYDPEMPELDRWEVDVEAWPYTSEFQNIMAFPWQQLYKKEAGGPDGSRGKFGPLMTDYLSANVTQEYDKDGNVLYIILDKEGSLRKGRVDEGVIISDTTTTLLERFEKGESLSNPELWGKVFEDPFRRFLLRGFFALGRTAFGPGGNELLGIWKKRDWKLEDLDSDKFWDDYKLARKVALKEELFGEIKWKEAAADVDKKYLESAAESINLIRSAHTQAEREKRMSERASIYKEWKEDRKKAVWDYADQTWWNGVKSTQAYIEWDINKNLTGFTEYGTKTPKFVLDRIVLRARKHDVNLGEKPLKV